MHKIPLKQASHIAARLFVVILLSLLFARYINQKNYNDYYSKTLLKLHTDPRLNVMTTLLPLKISHLLLENDINQLQQLLDANSALFQLVVTDCRTGEKGCPGQRVLFATSPALSRKRITQPDELLIYPHKVLRVPNGEQGEIIGRVYSISVVPASFAEDYHEWLRNPFKDYGPWKYYLTTMVYSLSGGFLFWIIVELFLKIRRMEKRSAAQREAVLIRNADGYLRQLEEKEHLLAEQERRTGTQFEAYIVKIKELERTLKHDIEYQKAAEALIRELEGEKGQQTLKFKEELERTNREKRSLQEEIAKYIRASGREKDEASRVLESAISPQFANVFEQQVFESIGGSPKYQRGEWLVLNHFDVAVGRNVSQFVDCVVINRECLTVIEAKSYAGAIDAEGDPENTPWLCRTGGDRVVPVKSSWGENPYHQVREYSMSLLGVVGKRSQWRLPVFAVIVFPEGTDISRIGERFGRYYRVTTLDKLPGVLEHIEAEARRENAFTKRPTPKQIENLIRGRSAETA